MRETLQRWVEEIFGTGIFSDVKKVLSLNPSTGDYAGAWGIAESIYNVCSTIGMGLVLIYFMVNLIERSTQQQNFDLEHLVKMLLKLFVGLYFIEHGLELMATIYSLSFGFINDVTNAAVKGDKLNNITHKVWKELTGENWEGSDWGVLDTLSNLTVMLELIIPWLVSKVMKVVINFVCYTRLIEFYIRTAAAPIALSDFFTEGVHGNGWKFIKGYIALALQAGIIMMSVVIFNAISGGIVNAAGNGYWAFLIKYFALAFATIGVILKSLSLTKEIVGA